MKFIFDNFVNVNNLTFDNLFQNIVVLKRVIFTFAKILASGCFYILSNSWNFTFVDCLSVNKDILFLDILHFYNYKDVYKAFC